MRRIEAEPQGAAEIGNQLLVWITGDLLPEVFAMDHLSSVLQKIDHVRVVQGRKWVVAGHTEQEQVIALYHMQFARRWCCIGNGRMQLRVGPSTVAKDDNHPAIREWMRIR